MSSLRQRPQGERRIGVFGGSFDPIHQAHLIIAERVRESLQLQQVWFVPCAVPPHKMDQARAAAEHRLQMIEAAIKGNPFFRVDDLEVRRGGISYTVDTIRAIAQRTALERRQLFLIIGADSLRDLPTWRQPEEILTFCRLAVVARPQVEIKMPAFVADAVIVDCPLIDISSRRIREWLQAGRSIRYLVPSEVEDYIKRNNLYQT